MGRVIVRYSAWILGRLGMELLKTPDNKSKKLTLTHRILRLKHTPFNLILGALFTRKSAFFLVSATAGAGAFYYANLEEVPVTGRKRFNIIRPEMLEKLSEDAAMQLIKGKQGALLQADHPAHARVERICRRLAAGAASLPELRDRAQARPPVRARPRAQGPRRQINGFAFMKPCYGFAFMRRCSRTMAMIHRCASPRSRRRCRGGGT